MDLVSRRLPFRARAGRLRENELGKPYVVVTLCKFIVVVLVSSNTSVPEVHTCPYKFIFYETRNITGEYAEWLRPEIMHRQQTTTHKRL